MTHNIIFDMDGVLIDSEALILNGWKKIAAEFGIADIESTLMQCIGINSVATEALFWKIYGQDFPYQKYKSMVSQIFTEEIEKNGLPVKPGVYELFQYLKENGWKIGLASSTREHIVKKEMESIGLLDSFHVIVCGDMVAHSKPHPEIYQRACELIGAEPSECYAVEDSPNGIRSAYRAGMKPIMVPDLIKPDEEIRRVLFREFKNLLELKDFFINFY